MHSDLDGGGLLGFLDVYDTVGCPGDVDLVFFSEGVGSVEEGVVQAGEVVVQEDICAFQCLSFSHDLSSLVT